MGHLQFERAEVVFENVFVLDFLLDRDQELEHEVHDVLVHFLSLLELILVDALRDSLALALGHEFTLECLDLLNDLAGLLLDTGHRHAFAGPIVEVKHGLEEFLDERLRVGRLNDGGRVFQERGLIGQGISLEENVFNVLDEDFSQGGQVVQAFLGKRVVFHPALNLLHSVQEGLFNHVENLVLLHATENFPNDSELV